MPPEIPGAVLIYSCQKYKDVRLKELAHLRNEYLGWKVFFVLGDPYIKSEYQLVGNILTLRCEDSYLHLLKKICMGFKVILSLYTPLEGILKCNDDIVFNETTLEVFLRRSDKGEYSGGLNRSDWVTPSMKYDSWIPDYYRTHMSDFDNPTHSLPSKDRVMDMSRVIDIQCVDGTITYISKLCCDIIVAHMETIGWDITVYSEQFGYIYIIEEPAIAYILSQAGIYPRQIPLFTSDEAQFKLGGLIGLHTNKSKYEAPPTSLTNRIHKPYSFIYRLNRQK